MPAQQSLADQQSCRRDNARQNVLLPKMDSSGVLTSCMRKAPAGCCIVLRPIILGGGGGAPPCKNEYTPRTLRGIHDAPCIVPTRSLRGGRGYLLRLILRITRGGLLHGFRPHTVHVRVVVLLSTPWGTTKHTRMRCGRSVRQGDCAVRHSVCNAALFQ